MPTIKSPPPAANCNIPANFQDSKKAEVDGQVTANAQHEVDVGAVVKASTQGDGSVQVKAGEAKAQIAKLKEVSVDQMEAMLANPNLTCSTEDAKAFQIRARVEMPIAVEMKASAQAFVQAVGGVTRSEGGVSIDQAEKAPPPPAAAQSPRAGQTDQAPAARSDSRAQLSADVDARIDAAIGQRARTQQSE